MIAFADGAVAAAHVVDNFPHSVISRVLELAGTASLAARQTRYYQVIQRRAALADLHARTQRIAGAEVGLRGFAPIN